MLTPTRGVHTTKRFGFGSTQHTGDSFALMGLGTDRKINDLERIIPEVQKEVSALAALVHTMQTEITELRTLIDAKQVHTSTQKPTKAGEEDAVYMPPPGPQTGHFAHRDSPPTACSRGAGVRAVQTIRPSRQC
jgi:hypothetical protein